MNWIITKLDFIIIISVHLFELLFSEGVNLNSVIESSAMRVHANALDSVQVLFTARSLDTNQHAGWQEEGFEFNFHWEDIDHSIGTAFLYQEKIKEINSEKNTQKKE